MTDMGEFRRQAELVGQRTRASFRKPTKEEWDARLVAHRDWGHSRHDAVSTRPLIEDNAKDLTDCTLSELDLSNVDLTYANLSSVRMGNIKLNHADVSYTDMSRAWLIEAQLYHAKMTFALLRSATMPSSVLQDANISGSDLTGANARLCSFLRADAQNVDFSGADVSRANFMHAKVRSAVFIGTKGLFGEDRADNLGTVFDPQHAIYAKEWDFASWAFLRFISTLHLFSVSYISFLVIILYATAMRWYNLHVPAWHQWAEMHWESNDPVTGFLAGFIQRIPFLPVQKHFGILLIALFALSLATTLFAKFCPEPVREATETRWTRELDQPLIEYRSAMYHARFIRYLTLGLFVFGGGYTVAYTLWRAWRALVYLMTSTLGVG